MRYVIMHKTDARWEAGAIPSSALIARVQALLGELGKTGALLAGEGLVASSQGVRLKFSGGKRDVVYGPLDGGNELPAAFDIVRAESLDAAIEWASRQAEVLGDVEFDIRPVSEAWDVGIGDKPAHLTTRRYMILRKATAATEAGESPTAAERSALSRLIKEVTRTGVEHLATETMRPSARGRRYKNSRNGVTMYDGPFIESKELLGGYVIIDAESLEEAGRWASRYLDVVEADEVDVRELN
jgi:hypothetical protein